METNLISRELGWTTRLVLIAGGPSGWTQKRVATMHRGKITRSVYPVRESEVLCGIEAPLIAIATAATLDNWPS